MLASSLTKAIFISRWEFSITLAASATFIEGARCVPAVIIDLYKLSISKADLWVEPDVIFKILVTVRSLSPGLILSGE